jgi:hypothetical protein
MHVARHSNHCTYQLSIMVSCNPTGNLRLFSLIRQIGHPKYLILIHDSIAQSLCCNKEYPILYPVGTNNMTENSTTHSDWLNSHMKHHIDHFTVATHA